MRIRPTARVLLLDDAHRLAMMKGRLPTKPEGPGAWFTLGGGVEPGETIEAAARREIVEESGITDFTLGPIVWEGEVSAFTRSGADLLVRDTYLVARCAGAALTRAGWQALEREFVDDMRWWSLEEIQSSTEIFYPPELPHLLPDILEDRLPQTPIRLLPRTVDR